VGDCELRVRYRNATATPRRRMRDGDVVEGRGRALFDQEETENEAEDMQGGGGECLQRCDARLQSFVRGDSVQGSRNLSRDGDDEMYKVEQQFTRELVHNNIRTSPFNWSSILLYKYLLAL
jgi:hypothetical protein